MRVMVSSGVTIGADEDCVFVNVVMFVVVVRYFLRYSCGHFF